LHAHCALRVSGMRGRWVWLCPQKAFFKRKTAPQE
jgi:hypothetical protein